MVWPVIRTSSGGNRDLVDDAYGVSTVTVGKFSHAKLLQFALKGKYAKMGLGSLPEYPFFPLTNRLFIAIFVSSRNMKI